MSKGIKGIFEAAGLVDAPAPHEVHEDNPQPVAATQPFTFSSPGAYSGMAVAGPGQISVEDQARFNSIEAQVYNAPSAYTIFRDMRSALNGTNDVGQIFKMIKAANPGITPDKVLRDIDGHLSIIAGKHKEFEGQAAQYKAQNIDGVDQAITKLTEETNKLALQMKANGEQILAFQKKLLDNKSAADHGAQSWQTIEINLRAPLEQAKQLLGGTP